MLAEALKVNISGLDLRLRNDPTEQEPVIGASDLREALDCVRSGVQNEQDCTQRGHEAEAILQSHRESLHKDRRYSMAVLACTGDYAARIWKCLRLALGRVGVRGADTTFVTRYWKALKNELGDDREKEKPIQDKLKAAIAFIGASDGPENSFDMALLAIKIYAVRNEAFHRQKREPDDKVTEADIEKLRGLLSLSGDSVDRLKATMKL
ncbi:hypothetical protein BDW62DRAFT_198361 [Aspergillus aurantiobrunneus]